MARRKKPENETPEQEQIRRVLEKVSNHATRSEKLSWERKRTNINELIIQANKIEQQMYELRLTLTPLHDEIQELRTTMVEECIHPYDLLVLKEEGTVVCKFCEKTLKVV